MKKIFLLFVLFPVFINSFSQGISGKVFNEKHETLVGVNVVIEDFAVGAISDSQGKFKIEGLKPGKYNLKAGLLGYEDCIKEVEVSQNEIELEIVLKTSEIYADEVVVNATKANNLTPITYTDFKKEDIAKNNFGKDVPYLLELTPSLVANSDAGAGVGYTGMRVRGTDMTRINITLDGIPVNDSESHGVWLVNMPDIVSSTDNIQIQRGVGTSTNGAAAFGANINFQTKKLEKQAYAQTDFSYGSFDTKKATIKAGTGLLNHHFTFDARYSVIESAGYIDRASANLKSYFLSGTYVDKKNIFKINVIQGIEKTYQAWSGVPKDSLKTNRTYNPYTYENETDNYNQTHYQAFYTHEFSNKFQFNFALHYTKGFGYYEQFKEDKNFKDYGLNDLIINTDTISITNLIQRKWLNNDFYGAVYSIDYNPGKFHFILGGAANQYEGQHYGQIIWAQYASNSDIKHEWYRNKGNKSDLNNFLKISFSPINKLSLWLDLQYRMIHYTISGTEDKLAVLTESHDYSFFNPKAGILYNFSDNQNVYASIAVANREPSRSNIVDADEGKTPTPETLYDTEIGYRFSKENAHINLNFFYMDYKDQLVLTGEINDVGDPVMVNIPKSYRTGVEFASAFKFFDKFSWNFTSTYSLNKIKNYTQYVDNWSYWDNTETEPFQYTENLSNTDLSFSPNLTIGNEISYEIIRGLNIGFISKYVSKQYIDNTSNNDRKLDAYFVNNLRLNYVFKLNKIKEISVYFMANNIFNEQYEANAWVYRYYEDKINTENNTKTPVHYTLDGYYPQAGIHFVGGISLRF